MKHHQDGKDSFHAGWKLDAAWPALLRRASHSFGLLAFKLLQILRRIFVEVLAAGLAAELDFLSLVIKHDGLAHLAEFLIGNDAGARLVGLHALFGGRSVFVAFIGANRGRDGHGESGHESRKDDVGGFFL